MSFLSDRFFDVMDIDGNGKISLREYLDYFEITLHGDDDEKIK